MLTEGFYWLLNMSIAGTIAGACVLLLRRIRRLPRRLIFVLWSIPLLRLWLPVGIGSPYGLTELISKLTSKTVISYGEQGIFTSVNYVMAADSYAPVTMRNAALEAVFRTASVVWITFAVTLLCLLLGLYAAGKREVENAVPLYENIFLSDQIRSPAVYGILRPQIVLPASYRDRELCLILAHEKAHIRRWDNLWRLLALTTAVIHWFNPFTWLFLKRFLEDLELSCDEMVLKKIPPYQRKAYALELLNCYQSSSITASAFGGAGLRTRVENILSYKKLSAFSALCLFILAIAFAYALLANPV